MKRILALLLAVGMMLGITGCGGDGKDSGVQTITYWTFSAHDKELMTRKVDEFNEGKGKELGVKINYVIKSDMSATMIDLGYESGQAPDLFETCDIQKLAANGSLIAYEDLPGGKEYIAQFDGLLRETVNQVDSKTYTAIRKYGVTTNGIVYNKDMFKAAGIVDEKGEAKPPKTIAEVREYAKKLTDASKGKYGLIAPMKFGNWLTNDVRAVMQSDAGHMGYDPKTGLYDYSEMAPAAQLYVDLKKDGSLFPGAETLDNDAARARFAEGDVGMKFAASYDYGVYTDQFPAKCEWGVAPVPTQDENPKYRQLYTLSYTPYMNIQLLDKISGETIMEIMKFLNSDELAEEQYKAGYGLPLNSEIAEKVTLDAKMANWKAFAGLTAISAVNPVSRKFDMSKYPTFQEQYIDKVFNNGMDVKAFLKEYGDLTNKEIEAYQKLHTEYNGQQFINKDYDISRD